MCSGKVTNQNMVWMCNRCKRRICATCVESIPMRSQERIKHIRDQNREYQGYWSHAVNIDELTDDTAMWSSSSCGEGTRRLDVTYEMCARYELEEGRNPFNSWDYHYEPYEADTMGTFRNPERRHEESAVSALKGSEKGTTTPSQN